jgi:hypothetical protein
MRAPVLAVTTLLAAALQAQASAAPTAAPTTDPLPAAPQTTPEASGYGKTSTAAEVAAFLAALRGLAHGERLQVTATGKSHEQRDLLLVRAALPGVDPATALRALVIANIHAGEVEGKEAVQALLREIALGGHEELLQKAVLWFVPIYNVDGNERIDAGNRPEQNGPDAVGQRANAQDLDLNRDFVKAEAPETRILLRLFRELDPHLFLDLHTTDGSWHGYHLTWAPSLSPNVDPAIAALSRALLEQTRAALQRQQPPFETFDYGNFETHDWDGGGAPESQRGVRGFWSYDHRARYGVNYFGLRNRIAILSEAYSNCDFHTRIEVTRAFVLGILAHAAARRDELLAACAAADRAVAAAGAPVQFGWDTRFDAPETLPVLVGDCERVPIEHGRGVRFARKDVARAETMPVFRRFASRRQIALPMAWALPSPPAAVVELLERHGIRSAVLDAPRKVGAERFAVTSKRKPKRPYQGHQELVLEGSWGAVDGDIEVPRGSLWIDARQPLGRLAAQLLEATSEDSLSTWNFLEAATGDSYPVLRIVRTD